VGNNIISDSQAIFVLESYSSAAKRERDIKSTCHVGCLKFGKTMLSIWGLGLLGTALALPSTPRALGITYTGILSSQSIFDVR
jgi:hypothetical protein